MIIIVEILGALRKFGKQGRSNVEIEEKATISTLVNMLRGEFANSEYIDESNLLIFVNGKEINVLNRLQTRLNNHDIVTFIPITHGG
jgi:molybdopterin converting factor small subunit